MQLVFPQVGESVCVCVCDSEVDVPSVCVFCSVMCGGVHRRGKHGCSGAVITRTPPCV